MSRILCQCICLIMFLFCASAGLGTEKKTENKKPAESKEESAGEINLGKIYITPPSQAAKVQRKSATAPENDSQPQSLEENQIDSALERLEKVIKSRKLRREKRIKRSCV